MQESFPQACGHSDYSNLSNLEQLEFVGPAWWCREYTVPDKHELAKNSYCDAHATTPSSNTQDSHKHQSSLKNRTKTSRNTSLPSHVHTALKEEFKRSKFLSRPQSRALAMELDISRLQVETWFKQHRDKFRMIQREKIIKKAKSSFNGSVKTKNILSTPSTSFEFLSSHVPAEPAPNQMFAKHRQIAERVWSLAMK